MSKKADYLRSKKVYNDLGIISKGHPMISVYSAMSREVTPSRVAITVKGKEFSGPWYERGELWFTYHSKEGRDEAYRRAFAWVEENFPGMKMVKSPFSRYDYVPEKDLERLMEGYDGSRI
jgi:hypothetical protein